MTDRPPGAACPRWASRLLRAPLLGKILIANSLITGGGVAVTVAFAITWERTAPGRSPIGMVVVVGVSAVLIGLGVNLWILRIALAPLRDLQRTAERIDAGDLAARASDSPLADPDFARLTRLTNRMLDRADAYRARIRRLVARAVRSAEEERKRISWELHDDAAQRLATLLVDLRSVTNRAGDRSTIEALEGFRVVLADTIEAIRRYARGLRPPALDDLGVVHAIRGLARETDERGVEVTVREDGPPAPLSKDAELVLYRMVQEGLTNVVKHSGASRAVVTMATEGPVLRVLVSDDGRGFDVQREIESGTGLGLFSLRERAEYVGGKVGVESSPGAGTTLVIEVPLSADAVALSSERVPCGAA